MRSTRTTAAKRAIWKVGASLSLPVADADVPWVPTSAANGIFDFCGFSGPWGPEDAVTARKDFRIYDSANPSLKAVSISDREVVNGMLDVVPAGLEATAAIWRVLIFQST